MHSPLCCCQLQLQPSHRLAGVPVACVWRPWCNRIWPPPASAEACCMLYPAHEKASNKPFTHQLAGVPVARERHLAEAAFSQKLQQRVAGPNLPGGGACVRACACAGEGCCTAAVLAAVPRPQQLSAVCSGTQPAGSTYSSELLHAHDCDDACGGGGGQMPIPIGCCPAVRACPLLPLPLSQPRPPWPPPRRATHRPGVAGDVVGARLRARDDRRLRHLAKRCPRRSAPVWRAPRDARAGRCRAERCGSRGAAPGVVSPVDWDPLGGAWLPLGLRGGCRLDW